MAGEEPERIEGEQSAPAWLMGGDLPGSSAFQGRWAMLTAPQKIIAIVVFLVIFVTLMALLAFAQPASENSAQQMGLDWSMLVSGVDLSAHAT